MTFFNGPIPTHVAALPHKNGWKPRVFGYSTTGIPLTAWWPTAQPTRIVWGAIHGEEVVTLQLLRHLLTVVHADDSCAVVVPVLNPDGVLAATRQNERGVDLNRNFPSTTWSSTPQPTYPPTTIRRGKDTRTQYSSTGEKPGSETEIDAIIKLVNEVSPEIVIDLHTPLECVLAFSPSSFELAEHLAEPAGLIVRRELESPTTGDASSWLAEQKITNVTYECELAPLPVLWARHKEALVRCIVERRELKR